MGLLQPESGLLFWMVISFGVVFVLLAKFGFPVITRMVEERRVYVEKSLEAAKQALIVHLNRICRDSCHHYAMAGWEESR